VTFLAAGVIFFLGARYAPALHDASGNVEVAAS
jgi:hypothetical protein